MKNTKRLYEFLSLSISTCTVLAREMKFDKSHQWHFCLVTLYGSILEYSNSILIQIHANSAIGIPIILRSMIEAYVDFLNLLSDRSYGYFIEASDIKEWIKVLEEAKRGENPYLEAISKLPDLDEILSEQNRKLDKLKSEGYSPLLQRKKFEHSKMFILYKSIYNMLCSEAHNNIRALISRHVDINEDKSNFEIQFLAPIVHDSIYHYIDTCIGILIDSTVLIHRTLESSMVFRAEELESQLFEIRNMYSA